MAHRLFYLGTDPLTADVERELAIRWQQCGDRSARDALFRSLLRNIHKLCKQHRRRRCYDDVMASACMHALRAIDKFDPERGTRLVTYARKWIVVGISEALNAEHLVTIPRNEVAVLVAARKRGDSAESAAAANGWGVERIERAAAILSGRVVSLITDCGDIEYGERERTARMPRAEGDPESAFADREERAMNAERMRKAMSRLDTRERHIVECRCADDPEALSSIGRRLGIGVEWVRQMESRAVGKIRKALGAPAGECSMARLMSW